MRSPQLHSRPRRLNRPIVLLLSILTMCQSFAFGITPAERKELIMILRDAQEAYKSGLYAKSEDACKRVIRDDPSIYQAYNLLGMIYSQQDGREGEAITAFRKSLAMNAKQADVYSYLSYLYNKLGDRDKAIEVCREGLKVVPDDYQLNFNMGLNYLLSRNDPYKALDSLKKAYAKKPDNGRLLYIMGIAYILKGENDKALESVTSLRKMKNEFLAVRLEDAIRKMSDGSGLDVGDAVKDYTAQPKNSPGSATSVGMSSGTGGTGTSRGSGTVMTKTTIASPVSASGEAEKLKARVSMPSNYTTTTTTNVKKKPSNPFVPPQ